MSKKKKYNQKPAWRRYAPVALLSLASLAGLVAVVVGAGSDPVALTVGTTIPGGASSSPAEAQPVTVTGTPLPVPKSGAPVTDITGTMIPTISGFSFDGSPMTIKATGRPQLIVVMAHWCSHCNAEVPRILAAYAKGKFPSDVQLVGISSSADPAAVHYPPSEWLSKSMTWPFPVLADSPDDEAATALGLSGFPYLLLVDAEGKVIARSSGELSEENLVTFVGLAGVLS